MVSTQDFYPFLLIKIWGLFSIIIFYLVRATLGFWNGVKWCENKWFDWALGITQGGSKVSPPHNARAPPVISQETAGQQSVNICQLLQIRPVWLQTKSLPLFPSRSCTDAHLWAAVWCRQESVWDRTLRQHYQSSLSSTGSDWKKRNSVDWSLSTWQSQRPSVQHQDSAHWSQSVLQHTAGSAMYNTQAHISDKNRSWSGLHPHCGSSKDRTCMDSTQLAYVTHVHPDQIKTEPDDRGYLELKHTQWLPGH